MKKTDIAKYISICFSVIAFALLLAFPTVIGIRIVSSVLGVVAAFLIVASPHKSGGLFVFNFFIAGITLGFGIDYPFKTFPAGLVSNLLIALIFNFRTLFYRQMLISKAPWFEMAATLSVVALFTVSGILIHYGTLQWLTGIPIFVTGLCTPFMYKDRNDILLIMKSKRIEMKVGTEAMDFTLPDQYGNPVRLSDQLKKNHVLLIFVRGDWCPTCHIMLRSYFRNKEKFAEKNVRIIGIGPDPQGVNKEMMERIDAHSLLLSDPHHEITLLYASDLQSTTIMNKAAVEKGIPLPASFLVHQNGKIVHTSRSSHPGEILHPELIFEVLEKFV